MKSYRIRIEPLSSFASPLHSDTLFGSLCWIYARRGQGEVKALLELYDQGSPPFLVSNAFPEDLLPLPLSLFHYPHGLARSHAKQLKKLRYVPPDVFHAIRRLQPLDRLADQLLDKPLPSIVSTTTAHNTISRLTGTTGEEGSLYEVEEFFPAKPDRDGQLHPTYFSVYLYIEEGWENDVRDLFEHLAVIGFGGDRSTGKGAFRVQGGLEPIVFDTPHDVAQNPPGATTGENLASQGYDAFVTLSNFCPARSDPTEGLWRSFVKYGRLGDKFAVSGRPFKRPLIMFEPGSIFKASHGASSAIGNEPPHGLFGRLVKEIAPQYPDVVQYAFAFPLPARFPIQTNGGI